MIRIRLLNVSDCCVKSHLTQAGTDARAPIFELLDVDSAFVSMVYPIICVAYFSVCECLIITGVQSTDHLLYNTNI